MIREIVLAARDLLGTLGILLITALLIVSAAGAPR